MQLKIKQKKFSYFIDNFDVFENDDLIYTAKSILFSFPKRIVVLDKGGTEIISITKSITWIYPEFKINFTHGTNLLLEGKSWFYDYFVLRIPEGVIEVHHQKGLKLSIFQNNEQISTIIKNSIKYFNGDEYEIISNSDVNKEFLTAICLAWDMNDFEDSNTITFDLGNIGPVKKKGNDDWIPIR